METIQKPFEIFKHRSVPIRDTVEQCRVNSSSYAKENGFIDDTLEFTDSYIQGIINEEYLQTLRVILSEEAVLPVHNTSLFPSDIILVFTLSNDKDIDEFTHTIAHWLVKIPDLDFYISPYMPRRFNVTVKFAMF